MIVSRERHLR